MNFQILFGRASRFESHAMAQADSFGLLPLRPRFGPKPTFARFLVEDVTLVEVFLRLLRGFPCQRHSTSAL